MKEYLKQRWFEYTFSAILVCMAAIVISVFFGYSFSTNDDAMLRSLVEGSYTGTPEAHLIYIMYPLGYIGKILYRLLPAIPWYDIFMVGMHYISWILVLGRIGEQVQTKKNKVLLILPVFAVILLLDAQYVMMHQYTILAAWLAAVAILFAMTRHSEKGHLKRWESTVCIVFSILCLWLRKQVFFLAVPILLMAIMMNLVKKKNDVKEKKEKFCFTGLIFPGILAVLIIASFGIESIAYGGDAWKEFQEYNTARTDIYDYYGIPVYEPHVNWYFASGLDYGDYLAIDMYNSELAENLSTESLTELAQLSKQIWVEGYSIKSIIRIMLSAIASELLNNPLQPLGVLLVGLYIGAFISALKRERNIPAFTIATLLLFQFSVVGYFAWRGRFPERVAYGFYLMQMVYLCAFLVSEIKTGKRMQKGYMVRVLVLGAALLVAFGAVGIHRFLIVKEEHAVLRQNYEDWVCLNEYMQQNTRNRYCLDTKSFVFSTEMMFEESVESGNVVRLGTWVQSSPLQEMRYQQLGITEPVRQLSQAENFFYIQDSSKDIRVIETIMQCKGYEVDTELVDTVVTPGGRRFDVFIMNSEGIAD